MMHALPAPEAKPKRTLSPAQKSIRLHLLACGAAIALLGGTVVVMATTIDLSGAVIASGSLVVESNVKKVQHPTGGIVAEVLVKDGAHVEAGDLLVRLDDTAAGANLAAVTNGLWELTARLTRLETERDGGDTLEFPADLLEAAKDADVADIVAGERKLFELREVAHRGQQAQLRERIAQLTQEAQGQTEQIAAKDNEIKLIQRELVGVRELWSKNLVPIQRINALERDAVRLEGERGNLTALNAQTKGKISEIELKILQLDQDRRSEVAKEIADVRAKMLELSERKVTAADQLTRIEIRAPKRGIVHQLSVHTKGGVIAAGEQIMLIVPEEDGLVVEVKVAPTDIDKVQLQQPVVLRFPTFNARTTPELNGTVARIAADVVRDDRAGTSHYPVRIALGEGEIQRLNGQSLVAGMPVEAFIRTGERSMFSYMLKPLTDQARHAFRDK